MVTGILGYRICGPILGCLSFFSLGALSARAEEDGTVSRSTPYHQAEAILDRYCSSCHQGGNAEGDFSVSSYESLFKATSQGKPRLVPGMPYESLMFQVLTGRARPAMPPPDEPQLTAEQIAVIESWITQGANPSTSPTPDISPPAALPKMLAADAKDHLITAAVQIDDGHLALGRMGQVQLVSVSDHRVIKSIEGLPGKVTSLRLSADGQTLIMGTGQVGKSGTVTLVRVADWTIQTNFQGHTDAVYGASMSMDGRWLASGSYDRSVIVWDLSSGQQALRLTGHNGAVYDLDFHPSGQALATASADQTVKLWHIPSGRLLDTLGQPEGEMRCVRFSSDGNSLVAGSGDRRIRLWKILSVQQPSISPLLISNFAHDDDVIALMPAGPDLLISASIDRSIKLWSFSDLRALGELAVAQHTPVAVCLSSKGPLTVVQLKGEPITIPREKLDQLSIASSQAKLQAAHSDLSGSTAAKRAQDLDKANSLMTQAPSSDPPPLDPLDELEPNDRPETAMSIQLPAAIRGRIDVNPDSHMTEDVDLFSVWMQAGQTWLVATKAASDGSPLDSLVDVLDAQGKPIVQTRLQALQESYFTFRGKDSATSDDFRLHKWEDMELDEYLYANGEVTRLWLYPRGPDSGFKVYPGVGSRHTFFGTTAIAHALGQPAYVVRPLQANEQPLPNGLPVFPIYFQNDDDPQRELGADSYLTFTAPTDGQYLIRVRDVRGFYGTDYNYQLTIRQPKPSYRLKFNNLKMSVPHGSGREWSVNVNRLDGFSQAIEIRLHGLPTDWQATNPVVIQAEQQSAVGTIYCPASAQPLAGPLTIHLTATPIQTFPAQPDVRTQPQTGLPGELADKIELKSEELNEIAVELVQASDPTQPVRQLSARRGETVSALVRVDRRGHEGLVSLGRDDSGRNLPHGAFVDNVGLNGLLITEQQTQREIFITLAPKVQPGRYQFHFRSETKGNPTSAPIWLDVQP